MNARELAGKPERFVATSVRAMRYRTHSPVVTVEPGRDCFAISHGVVRQHRDTFAVEPNFFQPTKARQEAERVLDAIAASRTRSRPSSPDPDAQ